MRRTYPLVALVMAAAIVGVSSGSAVAEPVGPNITQALRDEAFVECVAGLDVAPVTSLMSANVNGVAITAPVNRTFRTEDAMIAVLETGQREVRFGLPEGTTATVSPDGGGTPGQVVLTDAGGNVAILDAPWAKDDRGVSLPTSYRIEGSSLIQTVNTAGAVFPIAADPKVTYSWMYTRKTVYFNKSETSRLAAGGALARLVTAAVPGLNLVTGVLTGVAVGAVALGKCVAITGTNTTFVPGVAVPYYYTGGYCR
jgi:hypothetical protein